MTSTPTFTDNASAHRYELSIDGTVAAVAEYKDEGNARRFTHTETMKGFEGQGLGSQIAKRSLDDVRSHGMKVIPQCPFIKGYIDKHAEYTTLLAS